MAVGSKMGVAGSEIGKKPEQITEGREQNRSVVTRWDRGICLRQVRARNRVELAGGCAGQAMMIGHLYAHVYI